MKRIIRVCIFVTAALFTALPFLTCAQEAAPEAAVAATPAPQPPKPAEPPVVRVVDAANSNEAVVSMSFEETPLTDVIKAFRDATGANIISGGTNLQGTVSVRLDKVPWRKGLSSILDPQGMQLVEQPAGSGIFIVTIKTVEIPKITRTFELNHAKADDVAKLFKSTLGSAGMATPFPAANVVILTAPEQQLGECEKIIKAIDKPSPQVYIEARFVELSAKASKQLGLKWNSMKEVGVTVSKIKAGYERNDGQANHFKTGGTQVRPQAGDNANKTEEVQTILTPKEVFSAPGADRLAESMGWYKAGGIGGQLTATDFSLTLSAFEQMDGVSIFSNPKIIVSNEKIAKIDMTTKQPNVEVDFQAATQEGQRDTVSTKLGLIPGKSEPFVGEAFFSYGITLTVTPRINPTGLITVDIEPSLSELDPDEQYYRPSGLDKDMPVARYPRIVMQRIQTTFTMQSGTTAVIGGLSKTTEANIDSGIPMLRELPWIGPRLFGWKSRRKDQGEIVIFVTVGIADPDDLPENIGMPKNAVLSRELFTGEVKEPGDRTKEEVMSLEDPKPLKKAQPQPDTETETAAPAAAASVSEREASKAPQPADVAPLLQDK